MSRQIELSQYFTRHWVAQELVERYFPREDSYAEPSCGRGAFLQAFPRRAPAFGVEVDPVLASYAMAHTGRPVIVGEFETVKIPFRPSAIVGNPPFSSRTVMRFLERARSILDDGARCGFILPVYIFQTASTVARLNEHWSIRQDLIPRNIFPGLKHPLCFAVLTKGTGGRLFNFALYHEQNAVAKLRRRYRELLAHGERSVWVAVTRAALEALGGSASLPEIYREIEGHQPTSNGFWREQVRKTLQRIAVRTGRGTWMLPSLPYPAAQAA
jgi:site-specific DNA-methyltransferase (adenine-specific)